MNEVIVEKRDGKSTKSKVTRSVTGLKVVVGFKQVVNMMGNHVPNNQDKKLNHFAVMLMIRLNMSKKEREAEEQKKKRREDPNPNRKGKAKNGISILFKLEKQNFN